MTMHFIGSIRLFLFVLVAHTLSAQTPDPKKGEPLPPDPLLLRLPPQTRAEASIVRTRPLTPEEKEDRLRLIFMPDPLQVSYFRDGKNLAITTQWEGGKTSESYVIDGILFFQPSLKHLDAIYDSGLAGGRGAPDLSRGDFPELSWISRENFVKIESIQGRDAFLFDRNHFTEDATGEKKRSRSEARAAQIAQTYNLTDPDKIKLMMEMEEKEGKSEKSWIDVKTLLPLLYQGPETTYTYNYRQLPGQVVTPSPAFVPVIQKRLAAK